MQEDYSLRSEGEEERRLDETDSLYVFERCGGMSVQRQISESGRNFYRSKRGIATIGNPVSWKTTAT